MEHIFSGVHVKFKERPCSNCGDEQYFSDRLKNEREDVFVFVFLVWQHKKLLFSGDPGITHPNFSFTEGGVPPSKI